MKTELDPNTWYQCDRCTACCKWPGDVRVEEDEISRIADFLEMSEDDFIQKFTRLRMNRNGEGDLSANHSLKGSDFSS